MEILEPTEDELAALQSGAAFSLDEMPDPSPEIVERAKALIGQEAAIPEEAPEPEIPEAKLLAFMAHLLGGVSYKETQILLGGRLELTFSTISAQLDTLCAKAVIDYPEKEREVRYQDCVMLASICPPILTLADKPDSTLDKWKASVSNEYYSLVRDAYQRFRGSLDRMLEKADDPNFWPAPS